MVREQMASVRKNESIIVVAIGQYIGEGFNYPRLDTMLMAMPISFDGNVEQYAGRLNRDYEGKKDVIIFDYIDKHIPVLERMYRLADLFLVLYLKGVSLTVMTLSVENYPEDGREHHKELISILERSGIRVEKSPQCHERFAIVDKTLIWYGSMNLLSNPKEEDSLMRLESYSKVAAGNRCPRGTANPP